MAARITLHAHIRYLVAANAAALLLVALLLAVVTLFRWLLSPLAAVLLGMLAASLFAAEILLWRARGIQAVEVDEDSLTLYRGRGRSARSLPRGSVARVRVVNRLGWRTLLVYPRSGRRVRIAEDAFPREEFLRLCEILRSWN
jgi:hypothetical protein